MFLGDVLLNLDAKGRLAIPTRYRKGISEASGGTMVVTISLDSRCLVGYLLPDWLDIQEQVSDLPSFEPQSQAIRRLLIGHANEVDMDSHGRVLIAPTLREWAGLDKQVHMVGQGRKFEIWDEPTWDKERNKLLDDLGDLSSTSSEAVRSLRL